MRFKMKRLSRAIKRGLLSTEGAAQNAVDLVTSWWPALEAFGCRVRLFQRAASTMVFRGSTTPLCPLGPHRFERRSYVF